MAIVTLESFHGSRPEGDSFWVRWAPAPGDPASACLILLHKSQFAELPIHSHWTRHDVPRVVPKTIAPDPLHARVNAGRWIVQCDVCNSAQLASRHDHRFFCVDCCNREHGGAWRPVTWPKEHAEIEAALMERPVQENRAWHPGEGVADLRRETAAHAS